MAGETALLIVDVQMGMFQAKPSVHKGAEVLARLKALVERARRAGVPVIFVQHDGGEPHHPLRPGAPGWPIHPEIAPAAGELVVRKRFSDSFQATNLQQELEARGIRRLVLAGIQTDYCVETTCRRAFSLGYDVTLVADGPTTWDSDAFFSENASGPLRAAQIIAHHNRVRGENFATLRNTAEIHFP